MAQEMAQEIEVRAFGKLHFLFKQKGLEQPQTVALDGPLTAEQLREKMDIPPEDVEVVFINHRICPLATSLRAGDRVAFVPPGIPTIHRFMLGFYGAREEDEKLRSPKKEE